MAEAILSFVLGKLGDEVVKEVLKLYGVDEQVEEMRRELGWVQAFLEDADTKRIVNKLQKKWVKEVRDLAYRIEDAIDTFLSEVPEKKPGKREALKRMLLKVPKHFPALHNLSKEINQIQAGIQEIKRNKETYGISSLGEGVEAGEMRGPVKPILLPDIDDSNVVGFEDDREKIVRLLVDDSTTKRSVVSIVGIGGLGKTTLAQKAYASQDVKNHFDIRVWIDISQNFEVIDILRKMARELSIEPPEDRNDHRQLKNLYESLEKERYLLVLDDIWTKDLWTKIKRVLPNANNGSRILITTRFIDIAKDADPTLEPYKLPFLTEGASLELFLKKALPGGDANKRFPNDLCNIGKQFAKKCGGLPLALKVLGGLLSKRPANHAAWTQVMKTMNWGTDVRECTVIISTSYDDLPFTLKSCFMYLAAFPEDFEIGATSLLHMWIAEGFIPEERNKTLEVTAMSFLEDLVQRSMIQVSGRDDEGSITRCRVHDLLLDLAIEKAKEDNFLMVCSKIDAIQSCKGARRLAIHYQGDSPREEDAERYGESIKSACPNLRSLFCYRLMPNFSQQKLLKVLCELRPCEHRKAATPMSLKHLRYVALSWRENRDMIENLLGSTRVLQTLYLTDSEGFVELPDCVWHCKTLRHVMLPSIASSPLPSVDLANLQTLPCVRSRESWQTAGLPKLPNLTELDIDVCKQSEWDTMATLLGTLKNLTGLTIEGDDIPLKIIDMRGFPFYERLQSLSLQNASEVCGEKIALEVGMFPTHLTVLLLSKLQIREDPMPVLEKLENLKVLALDRGCKIRQMCCSAGGFGQLEELELEKLIELEEWKIEEGAMPMLKKLEVRRCDQLRVPLGLQHLTALHELTWEEQNEISDTKANEIRSICKHVSTIHILPNCLPM